MAKARIKKGSGAAVALTRRRLMLASGLSGLAVALVVGALVFQDNIARFRLNPRTPFQIEAPPPAPNYQARDTWLLWPDVAPADARAEIFYLHSTAYYSNAGWNAPIGDVSAEEELSRNVIPNELGPFMPFGPLFAPRYREATLFSFFTHKFDGVAARKLAYADVRAAFDRFLRASDPKKPLVLVGYGQGALHLQGLLKDYFQTDEKLRGRLAAAYAIDQATPLSLFKTYLAATPPCADDAAIRCVISYIDYERRFTGEIERARQRSMVWTSDGELQSTADDPLLCVNPLGWTHSTDRVEAELHLGAASATGLAPGSAPPAMSKIIGAQCESGVLIVDRPAQPFLQRPAWFDEKWRARSYNLFYYDLAADADRRIAAAAQKMEEEYLRLDPIAEFVDLEVSPIHKTKH